jgi:hypothetical protein
VAGDEAFAWLCITNACSVGGNRVIKPIQRVGCGYRNQTSHVRRIVFDVAAKRGVIAINEGSHPRTRRATNRRRCSLQMAARMMT